MPNASQLRIRARRVLSSAFLVFDSDPDTAGHLAGQAAELALKARFCELHEVDLPVTAREIRSIKTGPLRDIKTHNLESLLTLAQHQNIPKSAHIDWDAVTDWDNEHKYLPVGSSSPESVKAQLDETKKLIASLDGYAFVDAVRKWARDETASAGFPPGVILIQHLDEQDVYKLIVSMPHDDFEGTELEYMAAMAASQVDYLPEDVMSTIEAGIEVRPRNDGLILGIKRAMCVKHGAIVIATNIRNAADDSPLPDFWVVYSQDPEFHGPMPDQPATK